jgi:hypothetical protein
MRRLFAHTLGVVGFSSCLLFLVGCGEDNEAAIKEQATRSKGLVNPSNTVPQSQTQADFFKNNPGSSPGATGSSKAGTTTKKQ